MDQLCCWRLYLSILKLFPVASCNRWQGSVADPDLQKRRGRSTRPWDKEVEGGGAFEPQFGLKIRGGGGGGSPGPLPWIRHWGWTCTGNSSNQNNLLSLLSLKRHSPECKLCSQMMSTITPVLVSFQTFRIFLVDFLSKILVNHQPNCSIFWTFNSKATTSALK